MTTRVNLTATSLDQDAIASDLATHISSLMNVTATSTGGRVDIVYDNADYPISAARGLVIDPVNGFRDVAAADKTPTTTQITDDSTDPLTAMTQNVINPENNGDIGAITFGIAAHDQTAETLGLVERGHPAIVQSQVNITATITDVNTGMVVRTLVRPVTFDDAANEARMVNQIAGEIRSNFDQFVSIITTVDTNSDFFRVSSRAFTPELQLALDVSPTDPFTAQNLVTSFIRADAPIFSPNDFMGLNDPERPWLADTFNFAKNVVILANTKQIMGSGFGFTFGGDPTTAPITVGTPYNSYVERIHNPLDGEVEYTKAAEHVQLLLSDGDVDIQLGMTDSPGDLNNLYVDETGNAIPTRTFFREEDYKTDWRRHGRLFNIRISDPTRIIDATTGLERPKVSTDPETGWRVAGYGVSAGREEARGGRARRN